MIKYALDELVKLAMEMLEVQETDKDIKTLEDILALKDLLEKRENSIFHPIEVDYRLRKKYNVIEQIEKLLPADNTRSNGTRRNWYMDILNRLNNDLIGICINKVMEKKHYKMCKEIIVENNCQYCLLQ